MEIGPISAPSTDPDRPERRRHGRSQISVELRLHAPEQHFVLLSRTVDLSTHGAFVRSSRALPVGTVVVLSFSRGDQRNPLGVRGQVVRTVADEGRSSGIAIEFVDLTKLDESLLGDLIQAARD